MEYLIDSNVLIDYVSERFTENQLVKLDAIFDTAMNVSIVTKIETLGYNGKPDEETKMETFLKPAIIFQLDDSVVTKTIRLRKNYKIKIPDAIIAATALTHNLTLLSRNVADFKNVSGLNVIDPHTL